MGLTFFLLGRGRLELFALGESWMDITDVFFPHGSLLRSVAFVVEHRYGLLISLRLLGLGQVGILTWTLTIEWDWPAGTALAHLERGGLFEELGRSEERVMCLYLLVTQTVTLLLKLRPIGLFVHVDLALVDSGFHDVFLDYIPLWTHVRLSIIDQEIAANSIVLFIKIDLSDSFCWCEKFRVFIEVLQTWVMETIHVWRPTCLKIHFDRG